MSARVNTCCRFPREVWKKFGELTAKTKGGSRPDRLIKFMEKEINTKGPRLGIYLPKGDE